MDGVHVEVFLAAGYALFLVAMAFALELVARLSHRRSQGLQASGFQYHHEQDAWECPAGQRLGRWQTDHPLRVVRYRAPAHVCNGCGIKKDCTDSDDGRLIERPLDSWLQSEIRRFHRGISMSLVVLAVAILLAEMAHYEKPHELALLGGVLAPIGIFGARIASEYFGHRKEGPSRAA